MRSTLVMLAGVALVVSACGGGEEVATTTSEAVSSTTTTTVTPTTTTVPQTTTTIVATTTTTEQIDVSFEGGGVTGPGRISAAIGEQVSVWVLSDVDAEIHVHGYDLFFDATAGVPLEVVLTADVPGIFEVEVEGAHTLLFELEVTG
jgi:ABC-type Fe3+-hydroxamate transport system substrate-binding protein